MKIRSILSALLIASGLRAHAFDLKEASTERFKVSYVEPEKVPEMKDLPDYYPGRESAIRDDQAAVQRGDSEKDRLQRRQMHFRHAVYPIRVTDTTTGIIYEVAKDRRTITATNPKGEKLWAVNPFEDAKLKPYRVKHPIIFYFGKSQPGAPRKGKLQLGLEFDSSQFGTLDLADGEFRFLGQD
ncbi:hypothetical protein [Haloferula sp. BvORR071]|uniref:hypothetical protein n=1 Tax=Haloferula sp. BvORR071 TaxID=1396141 RepID=UPI0005558ED0|nr:hypothetical protein [Haloferula sp. BvORR071]